MALPENRAESSPPLALRGGGFLLDQPAVEHIFTPEDFSSEAQMVGETAEGFAVQEVRPHLGEMEAGDHEQTVALLRRAGELGLLGADIPEAYGGLGLDKMSTTLIGEKLSPSASFAISFGAHVGIGTLPLVFFGTKAQKEKYLSQLASGEMIAAYALTEPDAGSDALGGNTTAELAADGTHYVLNGQKQWITNAGFADLFTVYAKVDGKLTAFLVERSFAGVSVGPEVKKMGLKGSSTRAVFFQNAQVPAENVLGEVGRGHIIAFNILNIGRWKLAAGCVGGANQVLEASVRYAQSRKQFDRAIATFPLIQQKIAEMATLIYTAESVVYRTAGLLDRSVGSVDLEADDGAKRAGLAIAEYQIEASINKVFGSEVLDRVADHGVQIHGGYGYMEEYEVERAYLDSRINRIFEGTNEINRLLIPGALLKRATKGELPLIEAVQKLQGELTDPSALAASADSDSDVLGDELALLERMKKVALVVAGIGAQKYGLEAEEEQEFLAAVADLSIEAYATESALLRAVKASRSGRPNAAALVDMATLFTYKALDRVDATARTALAALEEGDTLKVQLTVLRRLLRREPVNTVSLGRRIANRVLNGAA